MQSAIIYNKNHADRRIGLEDPNFRKPRPTMLFAVLAASLPAPPPSVGIIGAAGYVGSGLLANMESRGWEVVGWDRLVRHTSDKIKEVEAALISDPELHSVDTIVYLGGLTGRVACDATTADIVHEQNVADPVAIASRMKRNQLFFYASTSAIMEGAGFRLSNEEDEVQLARLDTYARSMHTRELHMRQLSASPMAPQLIGARFGTVIGVSMGQRIDLAPMALLRSAVLTGVLHVHHGETHRAFLTLDDLVRAMTTLIEQRAEAPRFAIYHWASFSNSIMRLANEVALQTRARIRAFDHPLSSGDVDGFSLSVSRFASTFRFEFNDTLPAVIAKLREHLPASITAKGPHRPPHLSGSMRCPVCGGAHHQEVLDLGKQPLANSFLPSTDEAQAEARHELRLVRCRTCQHVHLCARTKARSADFVPTPRAYTPCHHADVPTCHALILASPHPLPAQNEGGEPRGALQQLSVPLGHEHDAAGALPLARGQVGCRGRTRQTSSARARMQRRLDARRARGSARGVADVRRRPGGQPCAPCEGQGAHGAHWLLGRPPRAHCEYLEHEILIRAPPGRLPTHV